MLTMLMSTSIMTASMLMFMSHPMSLGLILLIQSLIVALITGFMFSTFWFSYIMFIIMVGGILVLFIYMVSIASNELFKFSNLLFMSMMMFFMSMMMLFILNDKFNLNMYNSTQDINYIYKSLTPMINFTKYLNYPSSTILFFMIIYMFITLVAVVKITDIKQGPLRQN
uniref:NADH-ubiquinone oxidoreductase chain 6 n=1 Tax=Elateroidea sp. BMNH 1274768 TaxID=1796502 RepID=A0A140EGI4_9COLE|nr:NADH dehydrogenase subunit 6 [Elateroidea sp. BMNH 1274768]